MPPPTSWVEQQVVFLRTQTVVGRTVALHLPNQKHQKPTSARWLLHALAPCRWNARRLRVRATTMSSATWALIMGTVSTQLAQEAATHVLDADPSSKQPIDSGNVVSSRSPLLFKIELKQAHTELSWWHAKSTTRFGWTVRNRKLARVATQNRSTNQAHCRSGVAGMRSNRTLCDSPNSFNY